MKIGFASFLERIIVGPESLCSERITHEIKTYIIHPVRDREFFHNNEVSSLDEEFEKVKPMMVAKWLLTGPKTINALQYGIHGQL